MKKKLALLGAVVGSGILVYSCGGGGGTQSGTVSFAITDAHDPQIASMYVTIREVRMENPSAGLSCTLFTYSNGMTMDLVQLANSMRLVDVSNCQAGVYTQFTIVMDKQVNVNGSVTCEIDPTLPDWEDDMQVSCNDQTCDVTVQVEDGGLVVQPDVNNQVALDFEIHDSDGDGNSTVVVDVNTQQCRVAFEIEEIEPEEMEDHMVRTNKYWEIEGTVTNLNGSQFTLQMDHGMTFTVNYDQQAISITNGMRVEVHCDPSTFDINNAVCDAVSVEIENNIS